MTALSGPIIFNNSTGSDSTSSGCGPSVAVTETITTVAASSSATVTSGSGYSVGDLMYIPSATGRKLNVIATISGTTITFDNVWDDSLTSVSAYIGGKRAGSDLSTDPARTDTPDGATVEIEYTGTDYTNTGGWNPKCGSRENPVIWKGTGSEAPRLVGPTGNVNFCRLLAGAYIFENLQFIQNKQNGGGVDCFIIFENSTRVHFKQCTFKSEQAQTGGSLFSDGRNSIHMGIFDRCIFDGNNLADRGFARTGGTNGYAPQNLINCTFKDLRTTAIRFGDSRSCVVRNCIIKDCADGIEFDADSVHQNFIEDNIFYNLSGNGITFNNVDNLVASRYEHNIFSEITGHAFTANADYTATQKLSMFDRNAFHNVTGSTHNNLTAGNNDITLTASPFVDAANGDFNLNATNGGGGTLRSTNYTLGG